MTWEIVAGVTALIATIISVLSVAVKINRTLVLLEAAVERLGKLTEAQNEKNKSFEKRLSGCDRRLLVLEAQKSKKSSSGGFSEEERNYLYES